MSQISAMAAATYASIQGVRQGDERVEQVKRSQTEEKDVGQATDAYVPTVESADAVQPVHDEHPKQEQKRKRSHAADDDNDQAEHVDVQA